MKLLKILKLTLAIILGMLTWPFLIIGALLVFMTPLFLPLLALLFGLGILTNEWLKKHYNKQPKN